MPQFQVYTSNRQEALVKILAGIVRQPLRHPFRKEIIVTETQGMPQWLSQELADQLGIFANAWFPYPRVAVWYLFQRALAGVPDELGLTPEAMTWALMRLIPEYLDQPGFEALQWYLKADTSGYKAMQLAQRVANLLDHYTIYRPELIESWEAGAELQDWQAILWRRLVADEPQPHRLKLQRQFLSALAQGDFHRDRLPERVSIFGLVTLPPFYLEAFKALGQYLDIHLFMLSPGTVEPANPLLAGGAPLMRDFLELLGEQREFFLPPQQEHALGQLQAVLLGQVRQPMPDETIQIHSFHSPRREVEFLKDYLLDCLARMPGLAPRDIAVLAPDLRPYVALIEAVFSGSGIPYRIAELTLKEQSPVFRAFNNLLELSDSRFTLPEVIDLLEQEVVYRAFGFHPEELGLVRQWLDAVRVRWGIDRAHREEMEVTPFAENTWENGLQRLLLGYALPGGGEQLFAGILPYDELEGSMSQTLGRLLEFTHVLFRELRSFRGKFSLREWSQRLVNLAKRFLRPVPDQEPDLNQLEVLLEKLGLCQAQFPGPVSLAVVRAWLGKFLAQESIFSGFTGQVCFAGMLPLRGVPFRVICLLGLNDPGFPTRPVPPDFDRMAQEPRPGDDNPRLRDRSLFLEALLAARDGFYVSYLGRSLRDNSRRPPSVVVSELLQTLEELSGLVWPVREHPLHPFDPCYFMAGDLYTYSHSHRAICLGLLGQPLSRPFLETPLQLPLSSEIPLDDLLRFWRNPCAFFLRERLQLIYPADERLLQDTELFDLDNLERWQLDQDVLERWLAGGDLDLFCQMQQAIGSLPVGRLGRLHFDRHHGKAGHFLDSIQQYQSGDLQSEALSLPVGDFRLQGAIGGIQPQYRLAWRFGRLRAPDQLEHWICHLALNQVAARQTLVLWMDKQTGPKTKVFEPLQQAGPHLQTLVELFREGQGAPLPFFPQASLAYAEAVVRGLGEADALAKTSDAWEADLGDGRNAYVRRCFPALPWNERFKALAVQIWSPVLRESPLAFLA